MKCEICGKAPPQDKVALHRINETGVIGIWRCTQHLTTEQRAAVPQVVWDIVDVVNAEPGPLDKPVEDQP